MRDATFMGYTPQRATAVWVGFPEAQIPMVPPTTDIRVFGGTYPAAIWREIMTAAHDDLPVEEFPTPPASTPPPTTEPPCEVTTENTPAGTPARSASSASASALKGVSWAGFRIIGQPAASAGPTFRVTIAIGKFHGVIAAQTPMGCF